jgi:hypothetical protein
VEEYAVTALLPAEPIRTALRELKSATAETGSEPPPWSRVLTIRQHEGALDAGRIIVIGDRGTGKSFWTAALQQEDNRKKLASVYPRLGLDRLHVSLGFGGAELHSIHPSQSELANLLQRGFEPEIIWRAVVLAIAPAHLRPNALPSGSWEEKAAWVRDDPARRRADFQAMEQALQVKNERYLVTFDALDTLSSRWADIAKLVQGLLALGLFLRTSRSVRIKLFFRPDMADNPELWAVGDSSKLRHDEVVLTWTRRDLHALLIQYLANVPGTYPIVDAYCLSTLKESIATKGERNEVPNDLVTEEEAQQALFQQIAGEFMGRSRTKGRTYTWVPNHLANARGHAAPRSFLFALGVAAEQAQSKETALDVPSIQDGVRQASEIRMRELREDYQWIDAVFRPLQGMIVPTERSDILARWRQEKVIQTIQQEIKRNISGRYLPPPRLGSGGDDPGTHAALLQTLEHLAIVEATADGRINMPDLFRLAAGVKRKGGVKLRP